MFTSANNFIVLVDYFIIKKFLIELELNNFLKSKIKSKQCLWNFLRLIKCNEMSKINYKPYRLPKILILLNYYSFPKNFFYIALEF